MQIPCNTEPQTFMKQGPDPWFFHAYDSSYWTIGGGCQLTIAATSAKYILQVNFEMFKIVNR